MRLAIHTIVTKPHHERTWEDMLGDGSLGKAYIFYSKNSTHSIKRLLLLSPGTVVYIYHTGVGFIGKGVTMSEWTRTAADENNVKLCVPLRFIWALSDESEWISKAVTANEINRRMKSRRKFRQRMFVVEDRMAGTIDRVAQERGVLFRQPSA